MQWITRAPAREERYGMIVLSTDIVENSVCVDFSTLVAYNIISIFATNGPFS